MTLPTELHEFIIDYLDFPSMAFLKHTCRYFTSLVKDFDIHEAEKSNYAVAYGLWACNECSFLLPSSRFSDKSKKGPRSRRGSKAHTRFCIPCGIKPRPCGHSLYNPGDLVAISGTPHVICKACSQFRKSQNKFSGLCEVCGHHRERALERINAARLEAEYLKAQIRCRILELEKTESCRR